ncbi:MAG: hypothetical protein NC191_08050 [Muribaculaceae bacterium]|nr:hypothetical protein [Muribaculaceae bacterium]
MVNEVSNVSMPIGMGGIYSNPYSLDDIDLTYNNYGYGMNNSIFCPMPMAGGMNNQQYYDNAMRNLQFNQDYNVAQQNGQRNVDLRINGSVEAVKGTAAILKDKILANEQDQIEEAFNNYVETVRLAYGDASEKELKARAATLYAQMNGGKSIYQDLRENSHGSFTQGAIQSMTFGLFDRNSAEDNISKITGAPVNTGEKVKQNIGRLTGAGLIGSAAYGIVKFLGKGKAGIIGLAAGALAGALSFLTGKATT